MNTTRQELKDSWNIFAQKYGFKNEPSDYLRTIELLSTIENNSENLTYPYILLPYSVKDILRKRFSIDSKNQTDITFHSLWELAQSLHIEGANRGKLPQYPPIIPTKKEAEKTYKVKEKSYKLGESSITTLIWFAYSFLLSLPLEEPGFWLVLVLISLPFFLIILCSQGFKFFKSTFEIREIIRTPEEIEQLQKKYDQEYNTRMRVYSERLDEFNKQRDIIDNNLDFLLHKTLCSLAKKTEELELEKDPPKRGRLEDELFEALMPKIKQYIKINRKKGWYYPDIVLQIFELNTFDPSGSHSKEWRWVDIEIDEPYDLQDKNAIHYIGCSDEVRNDYFLSEEWFVLRLSEKNIINNLDKCVELIRCFAGALHSPALHHKSLEKVIQIQQSISHPQWTLEEAKLMAIRNERELYLKKKITADYFWEVFDYKSYELYYDKVQKMMIEEMLYEQENKGGILGRCEQEKPGDIGQ